MIRLFLITLILSPLINYKNIVNNPFLSYQQEDLKVIKACYAHNFIGSNAIVEGKVVGTYRSSKGHVFLNFEQAYPNQCFTAVIFYSSMKNFGGFFNEKQYVGKTVQVTGFIKEYKGKPEIIVNFPEQIKIK
ncbi:MAG: hypothetical protein N2490_06100 [Ignavibacteria bacterium]|nr:hypothetical protein [Ignavibacteria bacterium]